MTTTVILLVLGLILLLAGGKYLVESSVNIARHFKIPTMIIGLTIVALGTSAPELLVSLQAAVQGHPDMAIGNVVGSNISNILLVLAATAIIFPISIQKSSLYRDWPTMMFISLLLLVFLLDLKISRLEGMALVLLLILYLLVSVRLSKRSSDERPDHDLNATTMKVWVAGLIFIASCGTLALGADLLIDNASAIATRLGISERVISISMVALGTSLPELATSLIAAFKKETNISIGNIIGSNIMNIISVLGITSLISPIQTVREIVAIDIPWMLGAGVLLMIFMLPVKRPGFYKINRLEGSMMLMCYAAYIYFIFT